MQKIKDIKFIFKKYKYEKPFHITGGISDESTNIEVVITCENGIEGFGEASPSFRVNGEKPEMIISLQDFVKKTLIDLDITEYRKIFDITDKLFALPSLKAALQFATLDAFSKSYNLKVCQLLGAAKDFIITDKTAGIDTINNRVKAIKKIIEEGFEVIKIKVGENLKEDIVTMMEIKNFIKDKKIIVDANMGYTPKQALFFLNKIYKEGIDIDVFEQPVYMKDIEGLKFVRYNSPYPVAADESAKTKYDVFNLIKMDAVDYINIKLMKSGISDALAIVEMVKSANKKLMIGCMGESSIGINQSVQIALGTGAFEFCDLDSHLMLKEDNFRGNFIQDKDKMRVKNN
jgi:L-alanine-DL-glutamate epimerase-like enolase superfamily enzyme